MAQPQRVPKLTTVQLLEAAGIELVASPGLTSEALAARLGVTVERFKSARRRYPDIIRGVLEAAFDDAMAEAQHEALVVHRQALRSEDPAERLHAADTVSRNAVGLKAIVVKLEQTVPKKAVEEAAGKLIEVMLPFIPEERREEAMRAIQSHEG